MTSLLLATHNAGKLSEFRALLEPRGITVRSAGELGLPEPEETGKTCEENATLKARAGALASGLRTLADDSGLMVPALGGAPGVYSARWAPNKNFILAFERLQRELRAVNAPLTSPAYFQCVLCLHCPSAGGKTTVFTGEVHGTLTFPARGTHGFGYDPVFIPEGHHETFAELPPEKKHALSHRARAVHALLAYL